MDFSEQDDSAAEKGAYTLDRRCFIVGAGEFDGFLTVLPSGKFHMEPLLGRFREKSGVTADETLAVPGEGDLLIAADGGYRYLKNMGMEPDVLLGDFDSLEAVPEHRHLIRHSPIKDDTDMALAVAYAEAEGIRTFFLYGGMGGRLDHTLANLQLLTGMARKGLKAWLIGQGLVLTAVTNGCLLFPEQARGMLSVFCQGEQARGVYEHGLKYELEDAVLTCDRALGVSNEFTGAASSIEVKDGTLLVVWDAANGLPRRELLR
ncbi:MAG: thiamine diphosphokinase [Lachnospiraceae bacterium]|nr:thiamine diphosphokinase [Lachnospiraceae bacterium]